MDTELQKSISDVFKSEVIKVDTNHNAPKGESTLLRTKDGRNVSKFILDTQYKLQLDEII